MLSEDTLKSYGIFNPTKVMTLINNTRLQQSVSEIDQMAIAGILSTQLLHKMFIKGSFLGNETELNNYRLNIKI